MVIALYDPAAPALTPRIAAELIAHEGIVTEAYRDTGGVWTWSVGLTDRCGHRVGRYRDNPQDLQHCLDIFLWALQRNYLPPVLDAFGSHAPLEHELAAALSFHWNTGAIGRAEWIRLWREGERTRARDAMLNWVRPRSLLKRRQREQALFFDGRWTGDGHALVYEVAKPAYTPCRPSRLPIMDTLQVLTARPAAPSLVPERAKTPASPAAVPDADGEEGEVSSKTGRVWTAPDAMLPGSEPGPAPRCGPSQGDDAQGEVSQGEALPKPKPPRKEKASGAPRSASAGWFARLFAGR